MSAIGRVTCHHMHGTAIPCIFFASCACLCASVRGDGDGRTDGRKDGWTDGRVHRKDLTQSNTMGDLGAAHAPQRHGSLFVNGMCDCRYFGSVPGGGVEIGGCGKIPTRIRSELSRLDLGTAEITCMKSCRLCGRERTAVVALRQRRHFSSATTWLAIVPFRVLRAVFASVYNGGIR